MEDLNSHKSFSFYDVHKTILFFLEKEKAKYIFLIAVNFIAGFYTLFPAFLVGKVVDFFTTYKPGDSLNPFYTYVVILGTSMIFFRTIATNSKNELKKVKFTIRYRARVWGFERLMLFPLKWHYEENTGNKVQRIQTGASALQEWLHLLPSSIIPIITTLIGVILFFAFQSPVILLFFVGYLSIFLGIERYFRNKFEYLTKQINIQSEKSSGAYIEGAGNILAIKALGATGNITRNIRSNEGKIKDIQFQQVILINRKWSLYHLLNGITVMLFLLLIGQGVIAEAITVGTIMVSFTYYNRFREAVGDATELITTLIERKVDLERMMPLFWDSTAVKSGDMPFPQKWNKIALKDAVYKYNDTNTALNGINLQINKNEKLGIAGTSGSGKSTLIKVLLGLQELDSGTIKIGTADYYDINHEEISQNIGVVLQESELFNLSLRDNITLTRDISNKQIEEALSIAQLEEVVAKLPLGLDTVIGERGYALSGGERQRVGIARAICKDSPILLLDEATSALDNITEEKIMNSLLQKFGEKKTIIVIAHRLSTLKDTDRIVVFEKGKIIEEGTYNNLYKSLSSASISSR